MLIDVPFYLNDILYSSDDPKSFQPDEFRVGKLTILENFLKQNRVEINAYDYSNDRRIASDNEIGYNIFLSKEDAIKKIKENYEVFPHFINDTVFYLENNIIYESKVLHFLRERGNLMIVVALLDTDDDDGYNIEASIKVSEYNNKLFDTKQDAEAYLEKIK